MSVLIFIDAAEGQVKKSSLEALTYGAKISEQLGVAAEGVVLGNVTEDLAALGKYGVKKIHQVSNDALKNLDAQVYANVIAQVAQASGATVIVFSNSMDGKAIAPRLSARMKAGLVAGAVALPDTSNGFTVKKSVFSGKAFANISVATPVKIISLSPNAYKTVAGEGTAEVVAFSATVDTPKVKVTSVNKASGEVSLTEAEIVVSAGRGLKGPENWGMVEELAKLLHAATACSRPVADADWRPHNEHVGQTGFAIAPNLY
ncbi:MAG: electron transfer flavoprotein subunit alpha/FixB family protein, partial [Chitinophagaceae bacterium]|nr:electron transfer flavoprotein subunit alpha/FixB family protein [Chitinophagaceae bacterium]